MENIVCTVEAIVFSNESNGFHVLSVRLDQDKNPNYCGYGRETIVGTFYDIKIGSVLNCSGEWIYNAKYGSHQFKVETWTPSVPTSIDGIEKYLGSGLIKGIGPVTAAKIVSYFGEDTIKIIEDNPDRLKEVPGIGDDRAWKIIENWESQKEVRDVISFFVGNGINSSIAIKIYKKYGSLSISVVSKNPYCLIDDIWGIGFKTADSIALKLGIARDDPKRCRKGIEYALTRFSDLGHVYATYDELLVDSGKLLELSPEVLVRSIKDMVMTGDLVKEDDDYYLPKMFKAESGTAKILMKILRSREGKGVLEMPDLAELQKITGMTYDEVQVDAIKEAIKSKVMVLTGGPGSGKTTTVNGIIQAMYLNGLDVVLAAPTGRAAKRMKEQTGIEARTIHRLLEFDPESRMFKRNEENPIDGDVLVIDESSMIDISLMYSLLKAIPNSMRVIFVGDVDQLPSVGPGTVLSDLIECGSLPVVKLTRIFRQAQGSRIITNAYKINHSEFPDLSNEGDTDFFFFEKERPQDIGRFIVDLVKNHIPGSFGFGKGDIQVLAPMRKGPIGTIALNESLQRSLNNSNISVTASGTTYKLGDRVMQIRNNYGKDVFNGDIGEVTGIDKEDHTLEITYDGGKKVTYEEYEMDEVVLAYATTIHKSQGSEFPVIVVPVSMGHFVMLQKNLIYTAVTRAKKLCILVGTKGAIQYAINNIKPLERNTKLKDRIKTL